MAKTASLVLLIIVCAYRVGCGQSSEVTQATEWFAVNATVNFGKRLSFITDENLRFVGNFQTSQMLARVGVDVQIVKNLSIVPLGYAYVWNYRYGEQPSPFANNEYRFWQQVQYKHKVGKLNLAHRVRVEERAIERHYISPAMELVNDGYSNRQFRVRYRLSVTLPLKKAGAAESHSYVNVFDEVMFSTGDLVRSTQPGQNRIFAGYGYHLSKAVSIVGGAFYQLIKKDNGLQKENNVGVLVQANFVVDVLH